MNHLKNSLLPVLGMLVLIFFIGLSYINNYIFFDKLLMCSIVLAIIFFMRLQESVPSHNSDEQNFDRLQGKE